MEPDATKEPQSSIPQTDIGATETQKIVQNLYRGVWKEEIDDGDAIPVGGSFLNDQLDIILEVDTGWLEETLGKFTKERVDMVYASNREGIEKLLRDNNIQLDPELFHTLLQVQMSMRRILQVGDETVAQTRKDHYIKGNRAKLSDFVGKSECAEQAVVGKLLLDNLGIKSTLMEGVHVDGKDEDPGDHTFLILDEPDSDKSLIFDIARPKASFGGHPRILRAQDKLSYNTFKDKRNFVVPATDIYNASTIYYGVGNPYLLQDVNFAE